MNKYIILPILILSFMCVSTTVDAAWYAVNNDVAYNETVRGKSGLGVLAMKSGPTVRSMGSTVEDVYYDAFDLESVIFTISISVYSETEDIYVSPIAGPEYVNAISTLRLYKDGDNVPSPITTAVYTDAPMTDNGNYFVEKGKATKFDYKLEYMRDFFEEGEPYFVRLRNIKWNNTDEDSYTTKILNTDFATEEMYF